MSAPDPTPRRLRATALQYDREKDGAPKVTASGAGHVAERILALAAEHGVPVREDPALIEALTQLELGQEIPAELFGAVAEALVWAYGLDTRTAAASSRIRRRP